ncbi:uncharacterized protein LOC131842608 isoform X3 [Achroia grisella]|uniref:uncharacterized protein LOC131842608 isoform X3 n=1 Tax=Achroia grisella TaxID=688607 RepID=UPI0027D29243|nr:uncharacterized protein LOC131842608 isoform X3 [Achroia grisella]
MTVYLLYFLNKIQMCTNSALVDSLECYMDDLVDCFQDFIKKSLIVISIAIGTLVVMLMYVLKAITERLLITSNGTGNTPNVILQDSGLSLSCNTNTPSNNLQYGNSRNLSKSNIDVRSYKDVYKKTSMPSTNTNTMPSVASYDEKVLKNIGFSNCSKSCMPNKRSLTCNNRSSIRPIIFISIT